MNSLTLNRFVFLADLSCIGARVCAEARNRRIACIRAGKRRSSFFASSLSTRADDKRTTFAWQSLLRLVFADRAFADRTGEVVWFRARGRIDVCCGGRASRRRRKQNRLASLSTAKRGKRFEDANSRLHYFESQCFGVSQDEFGQF